MDKLKIKVPHSSLLRHLFLLIFFLLVTIVSVHVLVQRGHDWAVYEISLNDAKAPRGLSPDGTYLEISMLKSEKVVRRAFEKAGLRGIDPWEVAENISILASDEEAAEKFSTRYIVTYRKNEEIGDIGAERMLELLLESYEETLREYEEPAPMPDWEECSEAEYLEIGHFFAGETAKLLRYVSDKQTKYGNFCSETSRETFASLKQRLRNFEAVDLKNYTAFVRQSGLAKNHERMIDILENDTLLRNLTKCEAKENERNDEFLIRLRQKNAADADEEKARQMEQRLKEKFSAIVESVNALSLEAAGSRGCELLTIKNKTGWPIAAWIVAAGGIALCALSVSRRFKSCILWPLTFVQRHFRWYRLGVCAVACLAGAALLWYASLKQTYIARVALRCSEESMEKVISTENIREALETLEFFTDVDTFRSGVQVNELAEDEIELRLVLDSDYSAESARLAMDRLLTCGFLRVGKWKSKDARAFGLTDTLENVFDEEHDYIEQAELLRDLTVKSLALLDSCGVEDSAALANLSEDYRFIRDEDLTYLFADILRNGVTIDRDVLLKKYREQLEQGIGETDLNEMILAKFEVSPDERYESERVRVEREILQIQSKLQDLHPKLMEALAQNYALRGAQRMQILSSVTVGEKLDVWLYAGLAAGGVLLLGVFVEYSLKRILFLRYARKEEEKK